MTFSRILGTGSALPDKVLTNADIEKFVDTTDQWIVERTGIKERRIAGDNDSTVSLGHTAAANAIEAAGIDVNDVGLIIVGTCTQDFMFPSSACVIQNRLGITNNIPAFDISVACAGFIYALSIADQYIQSGVIKNALVIGSEVLSRVVDWEDRKTCILFGDGAGAVVLGASDEPGIHKTIIHAQGSYQDILYLPNTQVQPNRKALVKMQGPDVFKLAVTELNNVAEEVIQSAGFTQADVDWLVPHQANLRIIQSMAKRMQLPMEQVILTLSEHGNTSSASIPLALDKAVRNGQIKRGEKLLFDAIGGGMAWGSALLTY